MKELVGEGALVFLVIIISVLAFTGDGAVSYKTQGTTYQTSITKQIQSAIAP